MTVAPAAPRVADSDIRSSICHLDAARGRLSYRGYDVRELSEESSFEEVAFLLVGGHLPGKRELRSFQTAIRRGYRLAPATRRVLSTAPADAEPMVVLRSAIAGLPLGGGLPEAGSLAESGYLIGQMSLQVSALRRYREGARPLAPQKDAGVAANFLAMLHGSTPDLQVVRAFDAALILRADNELNPSAYAARVAASCETDLCGCLGAAMAALGGTRHGGHSLAVRRMLEEVGEPGRIQGYVAARHAKGAAFAGFGHPVYAEDPRTATTRGLAELVCRRTGQADWFTLASQLEDRIRTVTGQAANIDYYLGTLYRAAGIPPAFYTPVFAVARVAGWIAHVREQAAVKGLIRPRATYAGPQDLRYPAHERAAGARRP